MRSLVYMRRSDWQQFSRQFLILFAGVVIVYCFRILFSSPTESLEPLNLTFFACLFASCLSVVILRGFSRYPGAEAVASTISAVSISYFVLMAVLLIGRIDYARGLLLGNYVFSVIILFSQHLLWPSKARMRIAVIGGEHAGTLPEGPVDWVAINDPSERLSDVDAVTVDLRSNLSRAWEHRITQLALADVPVYHIKHLRESLTGQVELEHLSETSYGTLSPPIAYTATKRLTDFAVTILALVILSPVMLAVAIIVRLDSPGPAIFRQRRVGYRGRVFIVQKFRTMRISKEVPDEREAAITLKNDSRITRVGSFLRKSRLDELPQLINVLRGEMSLIGPRPEAEILSKWYEEEIPFYGYRHIVRPGVTGWAQINQGHVTEVTDVSAKLNYDFYYIKNLSPWMDALIAVRTLAIMITGHGAK